MNKVTLIGNLGKDPIIRAMKQGDEIATFSLATSERWVDKDGKKQEKTHWHNIVIFNKPLVKIVKNYVTKGTKLAIEGQLETRKWQDQSGNDRYTTEVVLKQYRGEIHLLSSKPGVAQENVIDDEIPF